eukprot:4557874-Pyramimonas_sp.AAC.1
MLTGTVDFSATKMTANELMDSYFSHSRMTTPWILRDVYATQVGTDVSHLPGGAIWPFPCCLLYTSDAADDTPC